ncbi:MAG: hypothetical protein JO144_05375, partial [Actinobacteria bacterium]|nr:hypothetical protein [Actinomycetota bacterium]
MSGRLRSLATSAVTTARTALARRSADPPIGRREGPTVLPDNKVLQSILKEYSLHSVIDDDGDLAVRWDTFSIYFFH